MNTKQFFETKKIVLLALLTAVVILLQILASVIPVYPFRLNLVLIPIVVGAAMISPLAGCWLGLVFSIVVLWTSPDVIPFMTFNPAASIIVILLRGVMAGLCSGWVYLALAGKDKTVAVIAAAAICSIVNTGIFVIGIYLFFIPLLAEWGVTGAANIASFVFLVMIGFNFLFEFSINLIFSPAIVRLIQYGQAKRQ